MQLIIINGPCGIGKSTAAKLLHEQMPLSFLLDVDEQRRFISGYREHHEESGQMSHAISRGILRSCFELGRDVVLEKTLLRQEVLDGYFEVAREWDVQVREVILWASKEFVLARAEARGWREGGLLTPEKCELFWEKMEAFKETRPSARVIDVADMTPEQIVARITESQQ